MQPVATDGVPWSFSQSLRYDRDPCKNELMKMLFGTWTQMGPRNHVLDEVQVPTRVGVIFGVKWGCPDINRGRHTDQLAGCHSIQTNQCQPPPSPHFLHA